MSRKRLPVFILGLASLATLALLLSGCARMLDSGSGQEGPEVGPPRAIIVIDASRSVLGNWDLIQQAVQTFVKRFQMERDTDLVIIRLDSRPRVVQKVAESRTTAKQWEEFQNEFKEPDAAGAGTDQLGAMELVLQQCQDNPRVKPESVALLYFSDMLAEQPVGQRGVFREWSEFDWISLKEKGVSAGFYVFQDATHPKAAEHRRVVEDLKVASVDAGVLADWIDSLTLKDDLQHGRFRGPAFQ